MLVGILLKLDDQIVFYEFNSNTGSDKKLISVQLKKLAVHQATIIEKQQTSNIDVINLEQNDVNIMESFNHIKNIDNKQFTLYLIKQSEILTIYLLYLADDIETNALTQIAQLFDTKIKSYFIDENIENIPLYIIQIRCKSIYQSLMIKQNCCHWFSCSTKQHHSNYDNITEMIQLNRNYPQKEHEEKGDTTSTPLLSATTQVKPAFSRKNRELIKLQKTIQAQQSLERELMNLNNAIDPHDAAQRIIDFVERKGRDPLVEEDNPFMGAAAMMGFGIPIPSISVPDFYRSVDQKYQEWSKARQLVDNVFTDLENLFYLLSQLMVKYDPFLDSDIQSVLLYIVLIFVNIMIYVLIAAVALIIILPSCFFLLIVRMKRIEIDIEGLEQRDEQLMVESCCQRFCRLISQFIRALFVFLFLVLYPVIIIYDIIPRYYYKDYVSIICISSYLFVILGLQLFGTVRAIRSYHERKKMNQEDNSYKSKYLFQQKQFKWNIGSMIAIILMFYEIFQLIMFTFQAIEQDNNDEESSVWTADSLGINADALHRFSEFIINICYISISFLEDNILDFYMIFSCFSVGLLILIFVVRFLYELREYGIMKYINDDTEGYRIKAHKFYFHSFIGAIVYGHGKLKNINKYTSKIVSLLSNALFIVICQKLVLILSCNNGYWRLDRDEQCWQGKHRVYALISLILLGYYIPICVMISPMFAEDITESDETDKEEEEETNKSKKGLCCGRKNKEEEKNEKSSFWSFTNTVEFVSPYLSALTLSECFMLITAQFVSKGTLSGLIISQIVIMLFLLIFTIRWALHNLYLYGLTNNEPGFPFSSSIIRSFGYLCGFVACCIQIFYYVNVIDYTISLLFTWISIILLSLIMIVMFYKYYSIYCYDQLMDDKVMLNYNKETNIIKLKFNQSIK